MISEEGIYYPEFIGDDIRRMLKLCESFGIGATVKYHDYEHKYALIMTFDTSADLFLWKLSTRDDIADFFALEYKIKE